MEIRSEQLGCKTRIGPAGWSYRDWGSTAYPTPQPRNFHEVAYLANYFSLIEITSSFYRHLRPELSHLWVKKVANIPQFQFTVKLNRIFTHKCILNRNDVQRFYKGLDPIYEAGRLGAVLMQFPLSFRATKDNHHYLLRLRKAFTKLPLVAELRHADWNQDASLQWLTDNNIGFANIDQPQTPHSMPPTAHVTSSIGYFRLHGRNYQEWSTHTTGSSIPYRLTTTQTRYNYLYSEEQLRSWHHRIATVSQQTTKMFVVTNNHFQGHALVNALQLSNMIFEKRVNVPPKLLASYPELAHITENIPRQRSLFVFPTPKTQRHLLAS